MINQSHPDISTIKTKLVNGETRTSTKRGTREELYMNTWFQNAYVRMLKAYLHYQNYPILTEKICSRAVLAAISRLHNIDEQTYGNYAFRGITFDSVKNINMDFLDELTIFSEEMTVFEVLCVFYLRFVLYNKDEESK